MPSLVFLAGPIAGRRYKLGDGEYVIGRRSDCQIFVPDMRVSRQHARLWKDGESWSLEDLGSNNGTYINGVRLQAATQLKHEDEIMIANNKIRVEAQDHPSEQRPLEGQVVTIVDVSGQAVVKAREESGAGRLPLVSSGLISIADQKAVRLLERKLDALTQILQATASADSEDALLDKIADALLDLFPQAEDVGVLVEDEKSGELHVQCQRHRPPGGRSGQQRAVSAPVSTHPTPTQPLDLGAVGATPAAKKAFGGELRVPGTIIQHVVSDRRGVLLGDTKDEHTHEAVGLRMGAPLIYHGSHYGVVLLST
jgi:pSer/pThr/pTyr-binding forkhead associated (FHA) protein